MLILSQNNAQEIDTEMCTRPSEPRPRLDPFLRDRDVQNFVRDENKALQLPKRWLRP